MIREIWKLLKPFHTTFAWFLGLLLVYEALQIAESYLISLVIRFFGQNVDQYYWVVLIAILLIYDEVFLRLDNKLDWLIIAKQSYPIFRHLKTQAIEKFLEMDISWHQQHNSGSLVGKVNNGVAKLAEILDAMSWEFVPTLIQTFLTMIPLLILSPWVSLIAAVAFSLFSVFTVKANRERMPLRKERHDLYEEEWHRSVEMVQTVETSIMFGQKERLIDEYLNLHREIEKRGTKEAKIGIYKYNRLRIRTLTLARRLILVIWILQLYQGGLDIAGLVYVNVLTEKLFHSFWRFARLFDRSTEASEGAERLSNLMKEQTSIEDNGHIEKTRVPIGIELRNVSFSYDEKNGNGEAIKNLSLKLEPGKVIALVGPSGAGKTTIRKLIPRLVNINEGEIYIGGIEIRNWKLEKLRKLFSYVPQGDDVAIFRGTILSNISYPKPDATFEEIVEAAKLAGIHDFIERLEDGYKTVVGERGKRLSGGQKQRIALARAILADRPILILDEATSAVDAITETVIQSKMKAILEGKTALIIAHRLATIWNIADKIVVLNDGQKIEEGSHADLLKLDGLYAKMVALQTE